MPGISRAITTHNIYIPPGPSDVIRTPAPYFAPPVPAPMREPGTNYITIITAKGPHTTEHP